MQKLFTLAQLRLAMITCLVALAGCLGTNEPVDQAVVDDEAIRNYLATNNLQAQRDSSGIYFRITAPSSSTTSPTRRDTVQVHYTGSFLDDRVFETSRGRAPARFLLNGLIGGWQVMIPQMKLGERRVIYVPSAYGYGPFGRGPVPPNAVLIFDIELLSITRGR
ncbi:MAG: FKBP-type peptidyl-prolyl cis-trans isomerase [Bernardetiaceae bacterium]|jgi:FKBP-type peptidyl-prolyl cis-trans isomerase|nr:FKBP-type peptidyl-prolyl cis-trans isomerase [Bernardetiaceae bacterium]